MPARCLRCASAVHQPLRRSLRLWTPPPPIPFKPYCDFDPTSVCRPNWATAATVLPSAKPAPILPFSTIPLHGALQTEAVLPCPRPPILSSNRILSHAPGGPTMQTLAPNPLLAYPRRMIPICSPPTKRYPSAATPFTHPLSSPSFLPSFPPARELPP